jgi:putative transposase
LIPQGSKETVIEAIDTAVRAGARQTRACEIVGITPRTLQNWHRGGTEDKRKGAQKNVVRKLSDEEREQILSLCTSERFKDMTPHEIVAILAQESSYLASESTMYRVLRARNMVHHRGNTRPKRTVSKPPQVVATGPNQVFSWDITWLHTSVRGIFLFAYVIIDIFDRTIVGWEVHDREDEQLARDLFARLSKRLNLKGAHVIQSIASKIGCTPETLRRWVRQAEKDSGAREGLTTDEKARIKQLEKENRELKRANEILRLASAYFAKAELDRPQKK